MKAYVTLLSNRRYLEGVLILNQSLLKVNSEYPLVCLLSADVSPELEQTVASYGIKTLRIIDNTIGNDANKERDSYKHWSFTFDKLCVFGLCEFEKIVFLDSDMIVLHNIDHLFDYPNLSAAVAGAKLFGWTKLNSGLMVIEPDKQVERELLQRAPYIIKDFQSKQQSVGDQDVIQAYWPCWEVNKELLLDESYNMVADWMNIYIRKFGYSWNGKKGKRINVVHFIGHTKPWTPKCLREIIWVIKTSIKNPYFLLGYIESYRLLKKAKSGLIK